MSLDLNSLHFKLKLIQNKICNECDKKCKIKLFCPKMTLTTQYIVKYITLQRLLHPVIYPNNLCWEQQPAWYIELFSMAYNKYIELYNKKMLKQSKGNK